MSCAQRVQRLRQKMKSAGLDALFVTSPLNVYYLTGYRCRSWNLCQPFGDVEALALVQHDRVTLLCDDRHNPAPALANGCDHGRIVSPGGPTAIAAELNTIVPASARMFGFEPSSILHADAVATMQLVDRVRWQAADDLVAQLRVVKDDAELDLLKTAARITDEAFTHVCGRLKLGMSEHDVAAIINAYLRTNSEGLAFDTIVAFSENAAAPHYHPSHERKLKKGDLVLMDFGAVWQGYHGDMTRTVFMGKPDARQREIYDWVLAAQNACLVGLRAGLTEEQADAFCRDLLKARGAADRFIHGTGHGVGLAIHEPPRLKFSFTAPLEPGMVVTVEPGLYYEGWGGVRIEDVAIVTTDGNINITKSPKQLIEIAC